MLVLERILHIPAKPALPVYQNERVYLALMSGSGTMDTVHDANTGDAANDE